MNQPLIDLFIPFMMMFHGPEYRWFDKQSRTSGGSALTMTWIIGIFFFSWLYHSNLEANLAIFEYETPVDSLEGLA